MSVTFPLLFFVCLFVFWQVSILLLFYLLSLFSLLWSPLYEHRPALGVRKWEGGGKGGRRAERGGRRLREGSELLHSTLSEGGTGLKGTGR